MDPQQCYDSLSYGIFSSLFEKLVDPSNNTTGPNPAADNTNADDADDATNDDAFLAPLHSAASTPPT